MKNTNVLIEKEKNVFKVTNVKGKVYYFDYVSSFENGFAKCIKDEKTYFINKFGDIFQDVLEFDDKYVKVKQYGVYGLCDKETTEIIVKPKYSWIWHFCNGFARVLKNGKFGFINSNGEKIIVTRHDYAWDFSCGYARIRRKFKKYNYIDINDNKLSEEGFFNAWDFRNNVAIVQKTEDDPLTRINTSGEEVN